MNDRTLTTRVPGTYKRTLYVLPEIPDDAPAELKNALAIRNAASVAERCPDCHARGQLHPDPNVAGLMHLTFEGGATLDGRTVLPHSALFRIPPRGRRSLSD